ncbi:MAG TPA: hypothetical protein VKP78_07325 [bacterium]|nr:hypothetical protein [bacterium]
MDEASHRWITPEGKEIRADHFMGLILKYLKARLLSYVNIFTNTG